VYKTVNNPLVFHRNIEEYYEIKMKGDANMDRNEMISEKKDKVPLEKTHMTSPEIDAVVNVSVSEDRLEARLSIDPPENGRAATYESMTDALTKRGVTYNINHEKLKELAENPVYHESFVAAIGIAPVNGKDGTAAFLIQTEKKPLRPKENEDGTVDYRELDIAENVSEGQVLCEITKPTEGSPGVSVEGKALRQKIGRAVPNYLGQNTGLNEEGTAIISKITGQVEFIGGKIRVNETFFVKENTIISCSNGLHVCNFIFCAK